MSTPDWLAITEDEMRGDEMRGVESPFLLGSWFIIRTNCQFPKGEAIKVGSS